MTDPIIPEAVHELWEFALGVTLLIFVPLSVYLLHRTYVAARSINRYAADTLTAAAGIAGNTKHIPALDATIAVGTAMVGVGGKIAGKLDTAASVLAQRAKGG